MNIVFEAVQTPGHTIFFIYFIHVIILIISPPCFDNLRLSSDRPYNHKKTTTTKVFLYVPYTTRKGDRFRCYMWVQCGQVRAPFRINPLHGTFAPGFVP
jgi:hypothetical protein